MGVEKREMRKKKKHEGDDDDEMFALPGKLSYQGRGDASCMSKTRSRCPRNSLWKDVGQLRWVYTGGPCPKMPGAVGALLGKSQGDVVTWPLQRCAARAGEEEEKKEEEEEEERRKAGGVSLMSLPCGAQLNTCCLGKFESCLARLCWSNLTE